MKRGRYSVIGKFYDQIIWTFDPLVQTAATDGVRLYFNPIFVLEITALVADKVSKKAAELRAQKINPYPKNPGPNDYDGEFEAVKPFIFILMHECYHMLYRHVEQSKRKKETANGGRYIQWLANTSMDLEINRDIEYQWPEFEGCTELTKGWIDKKWNTMVWSRIFDERLKDKEQMPPGEKYIPPTQEVKEDPDEPGGGDMPETEIEASDDYVDGWQKAIDDYLAGTLDPNNFTDLAVDKSKFTHRELDAVMFDNSQDAPEDDRPNPQSTATPVAPNGVMNQDEWNRGYNDCVKAILKELINQNKEGGGGKGGLKIKNLPQPPIPKKGSNKGDGKGDGNDNNQQDNSSKQNGPISNVD